MTGRRWADEEGAIPFVVVGVVAIGGVLGLAWAGQEWAQSLLQEAGGANIVLAPSTPKAICRGDTFDEVRSSMSRHKYSEVSGPVGDNVGLQPDAAHLVQQCQGLLPPLALLTSADCGTVGDNVVLQLGAVNLVQQFRGLLPPIAPFSRRRLRR